MPMLGGSAPMMGTPGYGGQGPTDHPPINPGASAGSLAGKCCGAEILCCEAQGAAVSTNWQFVGRGNGSFDQLPAYQFVGEGRGNYAPTPVVSYRLGCIRKECAALLACLLLAALIPVLWMYWQSRSEPNVAASMNTSIPTQSMVPNFDCEAGYDTWERGWSVAKKLYCCNSFGRGCEMTTTACHFDCNVGYSNWAKGWAAEKKAYCCEHARKGCAGSEPK
eukprot:CAMPEP_0179087762 /NCGR_PEP_ID=MMETSP0796-20121207/39893_1 /TAXON_ID=73915 /ORGANISM="Pyrodinium bahamense, Strain pbaha01" /LENGTH=220 /DNA_ID=CAMNT_0020785275 /DNA_START=17 /DNA_END=679 /DNA_ORIENTATION=-